MDPEQVLQFEVKVVTRNPNHCHWNQHVASNKALNQPSLEKSSVNHQPNSEVLACIQLVLGKPWKAEFSVICEQHTQPRHKIHQAAK